MGAGKTGAEAERIARKTGLITFVSGITQERSIRRWEGNVMGSPKWNFDAAIEELKRSDLRRKQGPIALRVSDSKIEAELHRAVECYFDNKKNWGLAPTKVKAKYGLLLGDLEQVRAQLVEIFQNPGLLGPLIASDKDYRGTSYSCQRLLGTFDRLYDGVHDRVKAAERIAANSVRGGRIKSPHKETLFLDLCGLYEKYTGHAPGRHRASGSAHDNGPTVRFVAAVFEEIEPEEAETAKLTSTISHAITKWKKAKGRKGTKYKGKFDE
jgi:hypothetical protein